MLLINSMITTVLPTPAPPNAPTFPPFRNGQIRSMTLMPVVRICGVVDWSIKVGAGDWRQGVGGTDSALWKRGAGAGTCGRGGEEDVSGIAAEQSRQYSLQQAVGDD